jgi:hypothetical protein
MSQPEPKNDVPCAAGDKSKVRKPYRKPEVRYERAFETMALSCGKTRTSTLANCRHNRKNS